MRRNLVIGFIALGACRFAAAQSAPLSSTAFDWLDAVKDEKTRAKVSPFRVPAVYLTSASLWFFSVLLFRRISKLRSINHPERFDSHPGHHSSAKVGYLAGALRASGRGKLADEIVKTMKGSGYDVRERSPFESVQVSSKLRPAGAPIVGRLQMLWDATRETVIANFPKAPGLPKDQGAYLHNVEEIYKSDAYHSLSIEGYSVTPDPIERVRQGNWNSERDEQDRRNRDALAARGYWQAFQLVKESVGKRSAALLGALLPATSTRIGIGSYSSRA